MIGKVATAAGSSAFYTPATVGTPMEGGIPWRHDADGLP